MVIRYSRLTYLEQGVRMEFRMKKLNVKVSQILTFSIIWVRAASKLVCAVIVNVFVRFIRALV